MKRITQGRRRGEAKARQRHDDEPDPSSAPPSIAARRLPRRAGRPRTTKPTSRMKHSRATPTVSATSAPASAMARRRARTWTRNSWSRASRMNHSETKPMVGGSPARVIDPSPKVVALQRSRRPTPRSASSSSVPKSDSKKADEANSEDLATAWARTCRLAATSPMAMTPVWCVAAPARADAVADQDDPRVLDARVGDDPVEPGLHGGEDDAEQGGDAADDEHGGGQPDRRAAEDAEEPPQAVEADVDGHPGHGGPDRSRARRDSRWAATPGMGRVRPWRRSPTTINAKAASRSAPPGTVAHAAKASLWARPASSRKPKSRAAPLSLPMPSVTQLARASASSRRRIPTRM